MSTTAPEVEPNGGSAQNIMEVIKPHDSDSGPKTQNELKRLLEDVKEEARRAKEAAKNKNIITLDGEEKPKPNSQSLKKIENSVREALSTYKDQSHLIPDLSPASERVLRCLVLYLDESDITPENSPYVHEIMQKSLHDQIADPLKVLSKDELRFLQAVDNNLHYKIVNLLAQAAHNLGADKKEIEQFKAQAESPPININTVRRRAELSYTLPAGAKDASHRDYLEFARWFNESDDDVVLTIVNNDKPEVFLAFVDSVRQKVIAKNSGKGLTEEQINKLTSQKIENEIVLRMAKIYTITDTKPATEFFQQIVQAGFYQSIDFAAQKFSVDFEHLIQTVERSTIAEKFQLYRLSSDDYTEEIVVDGKPISRLTTTPTAVRQKTDLAGFLRSVQMVITGEQETKAFLHNGSALLRKPPQGDQGFYGPLAGYAQQLTATDYDSIQFLPDSPIFMSVFRLYTKYLEEQFARYSWVHQPQMFANLIANTRSAIEEEIERDVSTSFAEEVGKEKWRIRRAMTYGLGLARVVFMTEIEDASWADPSVSQVTADPTFKSVYTNDSGAIGPFNAMHHFFRWQSEDVTKAIVFARVKGFKKTLFDQWDHSEEWDLMHDFKKSFFEGRGGLLHDDDVKLLVDILPNLARVGSVQTRGSWRLEDAYRAWFVTKNIDKTLKDEKTGEERVVKTHSVEHLPSFKAIENIGYEIILDYFNNFLGKDEDFLAGERDPKQRDELFRYIYKTYINSATPADFDGEVADVRKKINEDNEKKIKKGEIDKPQNDEAKAKFRKAAEADVYKTFLYKALVGVIRNRMPTKFLRIDRRRFTHDGMSGWDKLRDNFEPKWGSDVAGKADSALKDILIVETAVRRDISNKMLDHVIIQDKPSLAESPTTAGFHTDEYVVNEKTIREVLTKHYANIPDTKISPTEKARKIDNAVEVYNYIYNQYFNYTSPEGRKSVDNLAEKLKGGKDYFPFALGTEELDFTFLSYRTNGQSVHRRAISDIADVENKVFKPLTEYIEALPKVALNPKEGFKPLLDPLQKIKKQIDALHGPEYANRVASELANLAIAYFKKDVAAQGIVSRWGRTGTPSSLAAEFAGGTGRVEWEWTTKDIDNFINELGREKIVVLYPYDIKNGPMYEREPREINLFGQKIKVGEKMVKRKPDFKNFSQELRDNWHATHGDIAWSLFTKYVPIFLLFLFWKYLSQSLKEAQGEKT